MRWRMIRHAVLLGLLVAGTSLEVRAEPWVEGTIRDRAIAHGVSPDRMVAVAVCESKLNPLAVGARGEVGLYQLAGFGLLPHFFRVGYDDAWSATQQADYAARAFSGEWRAQGVGPSHWSCAR